jgi:hypothetical protein
VHITTAAEVTHVEDRDGEPLVTVLELDGLAGRTRITWICGQGTTAQVDATATPQEIEALHEQMEVLGLDYMDLDEDDMPVPVFTADGTIGFDVYDLIEVNE